MKKFVSFVAFAMFALFAFTVVPAFAQSSTTTTLVVTPSYPGDPNSMVGVPQDSAPGFNFGSVASNGISKTDIKFTPEQLFGRAVTLGEISSMSYWTKKGSTHAVNPVDWYLNIYTKPYAGDVSASTWYGDRIGTEPYFAANINDPANTWNQWTTDGPANKLKFFDSSAGYFGSYSDPDWDTFVAGNSLSGSPYAGHEVLFFSPQTSSSGAPGFTGQIDGIIIELTDGSIAKINFEPFLVAASRDACKNNGYKTLKRADGTTFANQGDCVSYVNTGK